MVSFLIVAKRCRRLSKKSWLALTAAAWRENVRSWIRKWSARSQKKVYLGR